MKIISSRHIYFTEEALRDMYEMEKELTKTVSHPKDDPDSKVVIKKRFELDEDNYLYLSIEGIRKRKKKIVSRSDPIRGIVPFEYWSFAQ